MSIDMLNINYTVVLAEISNSYGNGNGRHGHVANIPHLLDLYSNRVPAPGRPPAPGRAKSLRDNCTTFDMRVSEQVFCHPYGGWWMVRRGGLVCVTGNTLPGLLNAVKKF